MSDISDMDFKCGLCLEMKSAPPTQVRIIHGSMTCPECIHGQIVPLFRTAIAHEHLYPPSWGQREIAFDDFKHFLTSAEHDAWEAKVEEYNTPVPNRIYCTHKLQAATTDDGTAASAERCNTFMGSTSLEGGASSCTKCRRWSCRKCGGIFEVPKDTETDDDSLEIDHFCKEKEADVLDEPGLEDHYQRCPEPTCGFIVELMDGCNAIDCERCKTVFCYICGESTTHEGDHWTMGSRCPRYGKPGSPNAIFDDQPAHHAANPVEDNPPRTGNGEQVIQAFRIALERIRNPEVLEERRLPQRPRPRGLALEHDIRTIADEFEVEIELQDAFGRLDGALEPLRAMHRLLKDLRNNLGYIISVELRIEMRMWPRSRRAWAEAVSPVNGRHEGLAANFFPAFFWTVQYIRHDSGLLRPTDGVEGTLRVLDIFDAYMSWDMTEFNASMEDNLLYHQRREDHIRALLQM